MISLLIDQLGPIFLLVGAGFVLAWRGLIGASAIQGLTKMTFWALIPATLFQTISANRVSELFNLNIWICYYGAVIVAALIVFIVLTRWQKNNRAEGIVLTFGTIFSNIGMLGIPIIDILYGHDGLLVLATILCIHALSLLTPTILLMEWSRNKTGNPGAVLANTLRAQICNPIIIAILCAIMVASFDIRMPVVVNTFFAMLKQAMPPIALMLIGAGIYGQKLHGNMTTSIIGATAKVCLLPALVFTIGLALHMPAKIIGPAIMIAALPPGVNAVLMAASYDTARERTATTMLVATLMSIVVIPLLAILLILPGE
jgi:predicted permease